VAPHGEEEAAVEITVTRTGGIAGVHERLGPVDTAQASNGAAIEEQVEQMGFFEMPERMPDDGGIADAFGYEIEVADGSRRHSVAFTEPMDDSRRGLQRLVALVAESGAEWQDAPLGGADPGPAGAGADGEASCSDWSAWYNRMPPNPDPRLHVRGSCQVPEGKRLTLMPGNVGIVPEPGLFVLEARLDEGGYRAADEVTWASDVGEDVQRVRIQGAASAEVEVTIAT
jgi:hypothetical protein